MARLKCFSIDGMELWFWSNDHEPPHFHAKRKQEWEISVNFLESESKMFVTKWQQKPCSSRDKKALQHMVRKYRMQLIREWENLHL